MHQDRRPLRPRILLSPGRPDPRGMQWDPRRTVRRLVPGIVVPRSASRVLRPPEPDQATLAAPLRSRRSYPARRTEASGTVRVYPRGVPGLARRIPVTGPPGPVLQGTMPDHHLQRRNQLHQCSSRIHTAESRDLLNRWLVPRGVHPVIPGTRVLQVQDRARDPWQGPVQGPRPGSLTPGRKPGGRDVSPSQSGQRVQQVRPGPVTGATAG
jgi:hypothetical protein